MARKKYTITMTFTSARRSGWEGRVEQAVVKAQIQPTIDHYRGWLKAKGHTETSLTVTDA
jgi:hypothetical protein